MRSIVPAVLAVSLAVFAFAQDAWAGSISKVTGAVTVNEKPVTVPYTLKKGDTVRTGAGATAVITSDGGDTISVEPNTTVMSEGSEGGIEYVLVASGAATGDLSEKTSLGVPVSWASAAKGMRTTVRVEAPADRPRNEGRFRTAKGGTWLRRDTYSVYLPAEHTITLWRDPKFPGAMCFRTGQQNTTKVEINKWVSGGNIKSEVPRATSGCMEDVAGNKTKISNDIASNKQDKIHVQTEFGSHSQADVGPGTYALIDNTTGGIEVIQEVTDEGIGEEIPDFDPVDGSPDASLSRRSSR